MSHQEVDFYPHSYSINFNPSSKHFVYFAQLDVTVLSLLSNKQQYTLDIANLIPHFCFVFFSNDHEMLLSLKGVR